jgi:hypothetical protein
MYHQLYDHLQSIAWQLQYAIASENRVDWSYFDLLSQVARFQNRAIRCDWGLSLLSTDVHVYKRFTKARLTLNTLFTRLATRVNRTYNRTNRALMRLTLVPSECIRESPVWFLKLLKKLARVPYPCMIVLAIVQDRQRPCETYRTRPYIQPYKTVRDRLRPYIQPHMKSTPRVSS